MSSAPLRVGIAGYGVVGRRRRQVIDAHPALRTVAVADRSFGPQGITALPDGLPAFSDYHHLLEQDFDILLVCLTNDVAADATILGLERGRHVFCEKPPGRDVADIERVIATERRHPGLKLKYGFNHRYHDSVRDALGLVRSGTFGRVLDLKGTYGKSKIISFGQSDWRSQRAIAGGGILLDQGIHMVDLMRLFGGEFTTIHSIVSNGYWGHDVEDNAYALMRSDAGVVAMLHSSATQWRHRFSLSITLERAALTLSGILSGSKSYGAETLTVAWRDEEGNGDPREQTTRYNTDPSWADEIAEFADAVREDRPVEHGSSDEALKTMRLVYDIYRADPDWRRRWDL
ncbi:Gfo/Idh/MocA family protein [Phaeospirillum tilakii]|uniref:Gfo/Idh/MocA family protein n=1 Tax=Phaeospirillum tilakii TaxID=741673 RepID=A0ABW5CET7_9PROT